MTLHHANYILSRVRIFFFSLLVMCRNLQNILLYSIELRRDVAVRRKSGFSDTGVPFIIVFDGIFRTITVF